MTTTSLLQILPVLCMAWPWTFANQTRPCTSLPRNLLQMNWWKPQKLIATTDVAATEIGRLWWQVEGYTGSIPIRVPNMTLFANCYLCLSDSRTCEENNLLNVIDECYQYENKHAKVNTKNILRNRIWSKFY